MTLEERIKVLTQLEVHLSGQDEYLEAVMHRTKFNNGWFTIENQKKAVGAIATYFLQEAPLRTWLKSYTILDNTVPQTVGLVMAGNIPLVGFHDVLCVFAAGHKAKIKLSDKDKFLLPYLIKLLTKFDERAADYFELVPFLKGFDAVIATGSNNSARYFEAYFGKYPNIIRKNRNAIAVLTGQEEQTELEALGQDVFQYYGLGCRNVSKIYVPEGYDFEPLLESLHTYNDVVRNPKYKNNFDYNYALYVLNKVKYMANGCIILKEDTSLQSHIAGLHYEYYQDVKSLNQELENRREEIQCVIARNGLLNGETFTFGQAQSPGLKDYADGVDTMEFLISLS